MAETNVRVTQLHSIDGSRLLSDCSEEEMRHGLQRKSSTLDREDLYQLDTVIIASFVEQSDAAFLVP